MNKNVADFRRQCQEAFADDLVEGGINLRFSTGSYDVDRALGGGLSRGRFHLWQGKESSCKTTLAIHAMREANFVNWDTGEYDPDLTNPTPTMFVDLEGTFDYAWADRIGIPRSSFDDYNYHIQPTNGEIAANTILTGIESGTFGLIVVDSNEAFVSIKTVEKAAEENVMCDRAKILARMYRVGQANLIHAMNKEMPWRTPTVLCLNQLRESIGGIHTTWNPPGGRAQLQYSSTIIQFNSPMVSDDSTKSYGVGEFKGVTKKNKTAPPKQSFAFKMALRDIDGLPAGAIDNAASILSDIKTLGLMAKTDAGWEIFGETYRVQSDFKQAVQSDEKFRRKIWRKLLEMERR